MDLRLWWAAFTRRTVSAMQSKQYPVGRTLFLTDVVLSLLAGSTCYVAFCMLGNCSIFRVSFTWTRLGISADLAVGYLGCSFVNWLHILPILVLSQNPRAAKHSMHRFGRVPSQDAVFSCKFVA